MIIALFGADGRAICTHAAVLLAHAAASTHAAATLLRVVGPHESRLPRPAKVPDVPRVVELSCDDASFPSVLSAETAHATGPGRLLVLDLPPAWLAAPPGDLGPCAKVVAVGPSPLERAFALDALRATAPAEAPWLLACGATSIGAFDRALREAAVAAGCDGTPIRLLRDGLPPPGQDDHAASVPGRPADRGLRDALRVLAVLAPGAVKVPRRPADALAPILRGPNEGDGRGEQDRLRDLADDLDAAEVGAYPTPEELAAAPVLDDWTFGLRPAEALVGIVTGHPDHSAGRRIRTSEVYASDRRTWARTHSRLYRLARPAGLRASLQ